MKWNFKQALRALTNSEIVLGNFLSFIRGNIDISPYNRQEIIRIYETSAEFQTIIDKLVDGFKSVPIALFNEDGERIENHPLLNLIREPNHIQTQTEFESAWYTQYKLFNEAFVLGTRRELGMTAGQINSMAILPSEFVDFKLANNQIISYTNTSNRSIDIPVENVMPTFGINTKPDETNHATPKAVAASLILKKIEQIHSNDVKSFGNQGVSVLVTPKESQGVMTTKQRENANQKMNSTDYANGVLNFDQPSDVTQLSRTPADMGSMQCLSNSFNALALLFNVPLPLISTDASTYNNVENARVTLLTDVLIPDKELYCEKLTQFLIDENSGLHFRVDTDMIEELRDVPTERIQAMVQAKAPINEMFRVLGIDPIDDPLYDLPLLNISDMGGFAPPITNTDLQ